MVVSDAPRSQQQQQLAAPTDAPPPPTHAPLPPPPRPSTIKTPVLQLQQAPLPPEAIALLNKGPKFALSHKEIPYLDIIQEPRTSTSYLDIIQETEKAARSLEIKGQHEKGEKLRQDVSAILHTANQNPRRHSSNLTTTEKKGLKIIKQKIKNNEIAITHHDKGLGFVTLDPQSLKEKATAAFQNVTTNTPNRTKSLEGSIQRKTLKLKKEGKISEKDYKQIYPSGCVAPASYPTVKAHKRNKDYPARNIISHRGCPQEGLASFLISIIRPLLKNSPYACKNSHDFIKFAKDIQLRANEILVSFDATALFPSIPLQKCIKVIKQLLLTDTTLSSRTSLTPEDITGLIELCLSTHLTSSTMNE